MNMACAFRDSVFRGLVKTLVTIIRHASNLFASRMVRFASDDRGQRQVAGYKPVLRKRFE
ncbi:hypothetical protein DXT90_14145 [Agrobacterium tumefaciens]|nr:hypothetical protein ASF91_05860 [Rhizobium sp. Leaf155]MQB21770.1 hypothetical protein [Agrobacterium tumefaciens]